MVFAIVIAFVVGVAVVAVPFWRARAAAEASETARQQATQDRQRVVEFMHLMAEALGEGLTRAELHQRIVHASILCTGALSACLFQRTERGTLRGSAVEGLFPPHRPLDDEAKSKLTTRAKFIEQVLQAEEFPDSEGIVGRVATTGRGELLADATRDRRVVRHDDPALVVRSVIAVPLCFRDRSFGILAVANPAGGRAFSEMEFSLMESLAEQAALALHNAEFLHLQMEKQQLDLDISVASGIQRMLLPRKTDTIEGIDLDARYKPAQKIGGDLYDVIPLSPTRLAIVVADVAGKGIPASLLMAICRTNLLQIAPRHDSPGRVLIELNRVLAADIDQGHYITMLYAVIDTVARSVTFARAGHELPLFARLDAKSGVFLPIFVGSEGMPLGMVPDPLFSEVITDHTEPFGLGDLLVLYTDGISEAPNEDGKEFSGHRLADVVRTLHQRSAQEVNDGILSAVGRFTGETPQRDDLTLVTVKRV